MNINTEYKAIIKLPYQPGVLKAVSCDANGKELSASILRTSGVPAGFRLTADRNQIKADGQDLAYIKLEVIDKDGNPVPDATIPVTVNVKGHGTLLAAASANLKDLEPKTSPNVTTYKGQAIIVVRSGKSKAQKVNISAQATLANEKGNITINMKY